MLLIRGNTRVADIYLTELDRLFRQFYARDVINRLAENGHADNPKLLDATDAWIQDHYTPGHYKCTRRALFFNTSAIGWATKAAQDSDPFADEMQRAAAKKKSRNGAPKQKPAAKRVTARKAVR